MRGKRERGGMERWWIGVVSGEGGRREKVGRKRGFVLIGEKGEEVMVGLRYDEGKGGFVVGRLLDGK